MQVAGWGHLSWQQTLQVIHLWHKWCFVLDIALCRAGLVYQMKPLVLGLDLEAEFEQGVTLKVWENLLFKKISWPQTRENNTILSSRLTESSELSQFTVQGTDLGIRLRSHTFDSISLFVGLFHSPHCLLPPRFTGLQKEFHAWPVLHLIELHVWFYYHGWANFTSISNEYK